MTDVPSSEQPDRLEIPPLESADQFEARVGATYAPKFKSKFGALTLGRLDEPGPELEFLVDDWLTMGDLSVIGGASKAGKSFFAIHMGLCIALGRDFFGNKVEQGLVIYQAGEGASGVKNRLRAWRKHFEAKFSDDIPFVLLQSPVDLFRQDGDTKGFVEECKAHAARFSAPLRAVFIDTLAKASVGASENDGKDMGFVLKNVDIIREQTRAHVALVHHLNADKSKLRGHTSILANIDTAIFVTHNEATGVRTAALGKQKDGDDTFSLQFELKRVDLGLTAKGKPRNSCVCLAVGQKEAIRRQEDRKGLWLKEANENFMRAFFAAEKTASVAVPAELNGVPPAIRNVVPYDAVKKAFALANPPDDVPGEAPDAAAVTKAAERHREKLKARLKRAREILTGMGVVGFQAGFMWFAGKPLRAFPHTQPRDEPSPQIEEMSPEMQAELEGVTF